MAVLTDGASTLAGSSLYLSPPDLMVFDGQSYVLTPNLTGNFPSVLKTLMSTPWIKDVQAIAGTNYTTRASTATARVDSQLTYAANRALWIDNGGQQDLLDGSSAATILSNMETYATNRLNAGWDYAIVSTVPDALTFSGAQQTVRASLNTLIRASSVFDAVADVAATAAGSNASNPTYYFLDHPTAAFAIIIAQEYESALATLGIT